MNGENPYAPPALAEPEAASSRYWYLYGTSLIVKNGTTLPKIDLETGLSEPGETLLPVQRTYQNVRAGRLARFVVVYLLYIVATTYFDIQGTGVFLFFFVGLLLASRLSTLRGTNSGRISFWTFTEVRRARRVKIRRTIRIAALLLLVFGIFGVRLLPDGSFMKFILPLYFIWLAFMLGLGIWALLDKPKYKIRAAQPGWLRLTPIHPQALADLAALQTAEEPLHTQSRRRLMHTTYYWRFPLRLLIGHHISNPLFILRAALMKLLRSRLLVRDTYHFSEAEDIPLEKLCPPLREAVDLWLAAHPGWSYVMGHHLPCPAGDLSQQTAYLASPGLEHCARATRAWMEQTPHKSINHFAFLTWLADGNFSSTCDQPILILKNPALHHSATGTPEQVFQSHLQHLGTLPIRPAADLAEFKNRIRQENEETDRLLTEKGYQSETREAS